MRVAENQVAELTSKGHDVTLVAGRYRSDRMGDTGDGRQLYAASKVIPKAGFAGLFSPGLIMAVARLSPTVDVVHIHVARDLTTLPAALVAGLSGTPVVLQPHGMIAPTSKKMARVLDVLITKAVLRRSSRILTLTQGETEGLSALTSDGISTELTTNGIPLPDLPYRTATDEPVEVLFLARLQKRKRPQVFVEMARRLVDAGYSAQFAIVGPDEGEAPSVVELIAKYGLQHRVTMEGALDPSLTAARMAKSSIYVLPSVDEIIPMSVLEAMSLGLPVVITDSNGLAVPLKEAGAAHIVDDSVEGLVSAVRELLDDEGGRRLMGARARALVERDFSIGSVVSRLERTYARALNNRGESID